MRHILTLNDLSTTDMEAILALADQIKAEYQQGIRKPILAGRVMGLLFSKPSLRTRVSFEAGMSQLGGSSLYLGQDVGWGTRESVADFAQVVSQYLDVLVCRTHAHALIEELAANCICPVINGLTDSAHPCQALADIMTLRELAPKNRPLKMTFVGDGNNVSRSLAIACSHLGVQFCLAAPNGYQLEPSLFEKLNTARPKTRVSQTSDIPVAVKDATVIYTDVWSSMGFEEEAEQRERDFASYQVNRELMALAPSDALFMHCLPAHRGMEVTDDVMDSPQSVVVQQAANRMHLQKGLLVWLLQANS